MTSSGDFEILFFHYIADQPTPKFCWVQNRFSGGGSGYLGRENEAYMKP